MVVIGVVEKPSENVFNPIYDVASSSRADDEVFDLDD